MAKFVRKNIDPNGTYHLAYKVGTNELGQSEIKKEVVIIGREILDTDDKKLIELLKTDPEIVEFDPTTTIEPNGEEE
jgi:hypothetical protein